MPTGVAITLLFFALAVALGLYFALWMPVRFETSEQHTSEPPIKTDRYTGRDSEVRLALAAQAKRLKEKQPEQSESGLTYFEWLTEAIKHLRSLWFDCSYVEAQVHIEDFLDFSDMKFPDPDYEWSLQSARDVAVEISHDGETFGSNE